MIFLRISLLLSLILLAACDTKSSKISKEDASSSSDVGEALNAKAIAKGILPDLENLTFGGRYETRSDLGTDKFCSVAAGNRKFNIGVLAVFGPDSKCEARGTATIDREKVTLAFDGKDSCRFEAEFDGIELRFPGALEQGCASYCSSRASFSGTSYFFVEEGDDNARRALGRDFEKLCP